MRYILYITIFVILSISVRAQDEFDNLQYGYIQALNKQTGKAEVLKIKVGNIQVFSNIKILLRKCSRFKDPTKIENAAFVQIVKTVPFSVGEKKKADYLNDFLDVPKEFEYNLPKDKYNLFLFSGWIFSSSPAISYLEDNIYDLTLLKCTTE